MIRILGILRLFLWAIDTLLAVIALLLLKITFLLTYERGVYIRYAWANIFVWIFGFRVKWEGMTPKNETCLYVSNHRSSIDPFIELSKVLADPVSRADLGNWPLIGQGARMTGIILVDRSSKESRFKAKSAIFDELQMGRSVFIYPEGGTKTEEVSGTFNIGSFQQAAEAKVRVVPIAIEYQYKEDYWYHEESAIAHMIKRYSKWRTPVKIRIGEPIEADTSWTLMRKSKEWIDEQIIDMRKEWD